MKGEAPLERGQVQACDGRRDMQEAIAELAERLPEPLAPLARIAYNYRWSWVPGGAWVFRTIDPAAWRRGGCNPRYVIEAAPPRRLKALASDREYVARVTSLAEQIEADLARPPHPAVTPDRPIAYFCSEYGIHCYLPLYGGGLGVLAGDALKAASDLGLAMVGIGLLYRQGYFHQRIDANGWQYEYWIDTDFDRLPAVRVTNDAGQPVQVEVIIRSRTVRFHIWRIEVGRVPLFLLDADHEDNAPLDRWITAQLYVGDRHTRLAQYAALGIGGTRALQVLGIRPSVIHLNEGHAALSSFERLQQRLAAGMGFDDALAAVREETIFTTHTPVPAGNEGYSPEEIEPVLGDFIESLGIPRSVFYDLGRVVPGSEREPSSITPLALRTSRAANGVSRRHGEVARAMWQPLWPGRPVEQVPITHVTNGVHALSWMANPMQELLDRHLGPEWRQRLSDPAMWKQLDAVPDAELWEVRCALRRALVEYVREESMFDRLRRGEPAEYVEAAAQTFDPAALTIGFARRLATYKRFYLLTRLPERAAHLLGASGRPIQFILAGKAHPKDNEAKQSFQTLFGLKRLPEVSRRVVFLEDYDLHMAHRIVAGVALWLNLTRPPLEASGTSGMKAVLNGGLHLSVLDGWWAEAYDGENGWAIASPEVDPPAQDDHDARAMLDLLEQEVIPLFYERDEDGIPRRWLRRVKAAMKSLIPRFTAERMLRDYIAGLYTRAPEPAAPRSGELVQKHG